MKKPLLTALLASLALAPLAAIAGDSYFGVNMGRSENRLNLSGYPTLKDSGTGYTLFGGHMYTQNVGVEVGVANLRKSTLNGAGYTVSGEPQSFYLAGRFALPLGEQFELFGKAGAVRNHMRINVVGTFPVTESNNQTSPFLGAGFSYLINKDVAAVIEYDDYGKLVKAQGLTLKGNMVSAGVRINF